MYRNSRHPIRKCGKCKLNFRTYCGLYENPHAMWSDYRKCPGHLSEKHYQEYLKKQEHLLQQVESKPSRFARREEAKLRKTEPHHDGRLNTGRTTAG